jgi:hypothetical protein
MLVLLTTWGCGHGDATVTREESGARQVAGEVPFNGELEEGARAECSTLSTRIWVLIGQGQFAEAEALIAEGTVAGLLSKPQATRMLEEVAKLTMRLGQLPGRLHRAPDFPSQLKDFTLYQIERMLKTNDFSLATKAQLQMAQKLIRQEARLMQKY